MNYPGGKNGSGTYQKIINQIPPHRFYIEPFLGGGAILRLKLPADITIGVDADPAVIANWSDYDLPGSTFICADAIDYLASIDIPIDAFIYLDPPYLMSTRSCKRQMYRYELSDKDHDRLLDVINGLPGNIAISGYPGDKYNKALSHWRLITFQSMTRSGKSATECLWMNYQEPFELHDYRYLGEDFRERERIKRKQARWNNRLTRMPAIERYAMLAVINSLQTSPNLMMPDPRLPGQQPPNMTMLANTRIYDDTAVNPNAQR